VDEEQFAILRQWGEGLERESRSELKAAGRAIRMLADEVEALTIELWDVKRALLDVERERELRPIPETSSALVERLRLRLRRARRPAGS
jgi:hypothetical protein